MEKLREYRMKANLKYQDMADKVGISKTYYWQIENDKRRLSYPVAIKIAEIFKVKPDYLFYEDVKKRGYKKRRTR